MVNIIGNREIVLRGFEDLIEVFRIAVGTHLEIQEYIEDTAQDREHQDQEYPDQPVSSLIVFRNHIQGDDHGDHAEQDRGHIRDGRTGNDEENERRDLNEQDQNDHGSSHQQGLKPLLTHIILRSPPLYYYPHYEN